MCAYWRNNTNIDHSAELDFKQEQKKSRLKCSIQYDPCHKTSHKLLKLTTKSPNKRTTDMYLFNWRHSICSIIIAIQCINVIVFASANEHLNILNTAQSQPCDRSRRIFTEPHGEFSDGPTGYNYTQVRSYSNIIQLIYSLIF